MQPHSKKESPPISFHPTCRPPLEQWQIRQLTGIPSLQSHLLQAVESWKRASYFPLEEVQVTTAGKVVGAHEGGKGCWEKLAALPAPCTRQIHCIVLVKCQRIQMHTNNVLPIVICVALGCSAGVYQTDATGT